MKRLFKLLLALLPSPLPVGMAEFDAWAEDIRSLLGPGMENVPANDVKFILATMVMGIDRTVDAKSKYFFAKGIRKAAANQIAGQVFTNIKEQQKAAEAARAEETAKQGSSDVLQVQ